MDFQTFYSGPQSVRMSPKQTRFSPYSREGHRTQNGSSASIQTTSIPYTHMRKDLSANGHAEAQGAWGVPRSRGVCILTTCTASSKTTMDGRDSLGSHGRVEAAANSSDDSLNSLFEDSTNPDKDSISTNSSLDPDSHERVSETEVKNGDRSRMGQSQSGSITSSYDRCKQRSHILQIDRSY